MPEPQAPATIPSLSDVWGQGTSNPSSVPPVVVPPTTPPVQATPPVAPPVPIPPAPAPTPGPNDPPAPNPAPGPNDPPVVDPNAPVEEPPIDPEDITVEEFFKQVDGLHGTDIFTQIEYGTTDPMSPEGIKMRDDFIAASAEQAFEQSIRESDPRAYAYLLHRQNGGSDEEFFQVKSFVLPSMDKLEESVDLQRTVFSEALKAKGTSEKQIATLLKAAIDAGELKDDAKAAYKEISDRDKVIADKATKAHAETVKQSQNDLQALAGLVTQTLTDSKEFGYQVPDTEKANFENAFKGSIYYENGQFWLMKPITQQSLPKIMETELFGFLGGKLDKMIEKQATTISARKFINRARSGDIKPKGADVVTTTKTLGEL